MELVTASCRCIRLTTLTRYGIEGSLATHYTQPLNNARGAFASS
jgi:hypothetical protein